VSREIIMSVRKLSRSEIRGLIFEAAELQSVKILGASSVGKSGVEESRLSQARTVTDKALRRVLKGKPLDRASKGSIRISKDEISVEGLDSLRDDLKTELARWVGALDLSRREAVEVQFEVGG